MPEDLDSTWMGRIRRDRPKVDPGKWIMVSIAVAAFAGSIITAAVGYGSLSNTVSTNTKYITELKADDKESDRRLLTLERIRHD